MQFITRLKTLFIVTCLVFVGQGFAAWDGVSTEQPQNTEVIDGKTFYLIENEEQLAWFAAQVNSGKWDYNAKLTANLDMSNPDPSKKSLWTPIAVGNGDGGRKVFKGTFDGNKHVISNLYISAEELITKYYGQPINNNNGVENGTAQNLGFIGCLTGTVKNLIIENIEVHGYGKGGLGDNKNLVDKPLSIGTVVGWQSTDASVIEGCYVTGVVITSGDGQAVGGIVGNVGSGTVRNCYSAVDVYASGLAYVGGIAGYTKKYSGNLVTMESCVYAGETLSTEGSAQVAGKDSSGRAGAIIGYQYKGTVTLSNLYYDQEQFPGENAGIGATTGGSTTGSTTAQPNVNSAETICLLNKGTFTDGVCNKNSPWEMGESGPVLIEYSSDGYKITFDANGGLFAGNVTSAVKYIKLDNFINDDGLTKPTRDDFAFVGWSTNKDATEPDQNLGTVSGAAKFYAVWNPIYTITFGTINGDNHGTFSDGSSTPKTVEIEKGKRISVQGFDRPTSYTENDVKYNFVGWAFAETPTVALVEGGLDNLPLATKDTTLLAVWTTAPVYTVSFYANGSTTASYVSTVYQNDKATELTVDKMDPNPGYTFFGWYEDLDGESFNFNTVINRDVNLFAKWEKDSYNITYENLNGAANPNPSTYTVDGLALQVLSLDDAHKFEGWCTDSELKNCITEIAPGKTGALTLYAKWSDVTYAIIYRAAGSGATGNVSQGVKIHGTPYTLIDTSYTRAGCKQSGWTTTLTGDKIYDFGDEYTENASITFYPTWDILTYTITYVCDGCTDNTGNKTSYTVETATFSVKSKGVTPPEGYKMAGWYSATDYETKVEQIKKGSVGDTTLYAKLNKIYHITYVLNGSADDYNSDDYTVDDGFTLNAPAPVEGYIFGGWFNNAEFEGDAVTEITKGSTGDMTLYAKWIPETVVTQNGAVTITETNTEVDGEIVTTRSAVINGIYGGASAPNFEESDPVEISSNIVVNSVTLERTFTENVISTLYVPFVIAASDVVGASVYQFNTVEKNESDGRWKFKVLTTETVEANTPYIILPSATQVTFDATSFILNTSNPVTHSKGKWEFKGTYELVTFEETSDDAFYVFAGQAANGAKLGEFVKSSGYANPMRAYLIYHKNANVTAKSASGSLGSNILLPDELDIEIEDENGIVVQTGTLNTVTGEVRMDRWFDLKGRKLNSRPTAKGTYYKNGKKAIIK